MPGMSANPDIFEHLHLPEESYKMHWLSWIKPHKKEPLSQYSQRLCENVKHDNVVLIGVSLGGLIVQEMSRFITVKRLVLISTVKSKYELPPYMRFGRYTKLYKVLPNGLAKHFKKLEALPIGKSFKTRLKLYERYVGPVDKSYLDWAIREILNWEQESPIPGSIHIHGDADKIFPIKYIKDCYVVKGGTHIMIVNRFKWLNQYLPGLIGKGSL